MGNWFKKALTALGPRAIGVGAGLISGFIVAKTGGAVNVSPEKIVAIAGTMLGTYAGVHRGASAIINPGDAASATLAAVDKQIKADASSLPAGITPYVPVAPNPPQVPDRPTFGSPTR